MSQERGTASAPSVRRQAVGGVDCRDGLGGGGHVAEALCVPRQVSTADLVVADAHHVRHAGGERLDEVEEHAAYEAVRRAHVVGKVADVQDHADPTRQDLGNDAEARVRTRVRTRVRRVQDMSGVHEQLGATLKAHHEPRSPNSRCV